MSIEIEELKISSKAIRESNSFYFRRKDALDMVKECQERDLAAAGIEGLSLDPDGILPHMDLIFDAFAGDWTGVVWEEFRDRCNKSAIQFLKAAEERDNLVFDFVVLDKDEFNFYRQKERRFLTNVVIDC